MITRSDLTPGYQATQAAHAVADFHAAHPDLASAWAKTSNSLILLTVPDEAELQDLHSRARDCVPATVLVREPDLLEEATALALAPSAQTCDLVAGLPLAGSCPDPEQASSRQRRKRALAERMMACEQTPGQDVLAHGASVRDHYRALLDHLAGRVDLHADPAWRLPGWVDTYAAQLLAAQAPLPVVDRYLSIHDCGKPSVLTVSDDGRRHFPGHAAASARTYRRAYRDQADPRVEQLIAHDLDIHLIKAAGVPEFCTLQDAATHLVAGLAEVTSNAAMFGGLDSTGFKIKFKALNARGNAICRLLFETGQS